LPSGGARKPSFSVKASLTQPLFYFAKSFSGKTQLLECLKNEVRIGLKSLKAGIRKI
jgi:hypothetical protein